MTFITSAGSTAPTRPCTESTSATRPGVSRSLIRRAMADRLPAEIVNGTRHGIDTADWFERLSDARPTVDEELRLLERNETARAVLDLPRLRGLADTLGYPP